MWNKLPDENYISNPYKKKSNHCKGLAVDLTLVDKNGNELEMQSKFDDFSTKSHRNYKYISNNAKKNKELLDKYMTQEGFIYHNNEWWHFHYNNHKINPILDIPL